MIRFEEIPIASIYSTRLFTWFQQVCLPTGLDIDVTAVLRLCYATSKSSRIVACMMLRSKHMLFWKMESEEWVTKCQVSLSLSLSLSAKKINRIFNE